MIIKWNKHKLVHASFLPSFEQIKCDELGEYVSCSILSSSVVYIFTTTLSLSLSLSLILSISLPWGPGHPLPYNNYYPSCVSMFIYQIFGLYMGLQWHPLFHYSKIHYFLCLRNLPAGVGLMLYVGLFLIKKKMLKMICLAFKIIIIF
jgi:hypothetical protein